MASANLPPPIEHLDPLIIQPSSGKHEQSFIVLHGRGSNGKEFGSQLLLWPFPGFENLRTAFPNAKFIFPTAAKRKIQSCSNLVVHQWFDCWSLKWPSLREDVQYEGLKESTQYTHKFLEDEIAAVGAKNVILWGLSQGWATSMIALLLWQGEPFAAAIGMCGWLPLADRMRAVLTLKESKEDSSHDPTSKRPSEGIPPAIQDDSAQIGAVVAHIREVLKMPMDVEAFPALEIPVFVGHGEMDNKVALELAQDAVELLRTLRIRAEFRQYENLMHWYSDEMIADIVRFIGDVPKWTAQASPEAEAESQAEMRSKFARFWRGLQQGRSKSTPETSKDQ